MEPLINTRITGTDGKDHQLVVSSPFSGGGSYHVTVDDYYAGKIVKYSDGWTACLDTKVAALLYSDDIGVIVEMVKGIREG